uniref:Uncharacterized protein n=1 Tax=Arundo donax TaxID=35708 RepID=A0A0A8ZG14_ARUDO
MLVIIIASVLYCLTFISSVTCRLVKGPLFGFGATINIWTWITSTSKENPRILFKTNYRN